MSPYRGESALEALQKATDAGTGFVFGYLYTLQFFPGIFQTGFDALALGDVLDCQEDD